ncbi:hypothetical protein CRUP_000218 [Coryphaenoides rupestris]|nr:hypothetical protein CRUP_000218 [Coryphaenoides rupestris]
MKVMMMMVSMMSARGRREVTARKSRQIPEISLPNRRVTAGMLRETGVRFSRGPPRVVEVEVEVGVGVLVGLEVVMGVVVLALRDRLRRQLRDRAEVLRRLHMTLIDKWRGCAQAALYQLQTELPADGHKASLAQLLDHLGLDHKILHFDHAEDDFTD